MRKYNVKIKGVTALMQHRMSEETILGLLQSKKAKKKEAKDEKTPREIADGHSYKTKDGEFYIPNAYICGAFIKASSDFKRGDSSRKSLKSVAAGAFRIFEETTILKTSKNKPVKDFEVDIKKAVNHKVGAVAICRPRFDDWGCEFVAHLDESIIDESTALQILQDAGRRVGIGSFRVSNGGHYGQFDVIEFKKID